MNSTFPNLQPPNFLPNPESTSLNPNAVCVCFCGLKKTRSRAGARWLRIDFIVSEPAAEGLSLSYSGSFGIFPVSIKRARVRFDSEKAIERLSGSARVRNGVAKIYTWFGYRYNGRNVALVWEINELVGYKRGGWNARISRSVCCRSIKFVI